MAPSLVKTNLMLPWDQATKGFQPIKSPEEPRGRAAKFLLDWRTRSMAWVSLLLVVASFLGNAEVVGQTLGLNDIQVIGTHNSYHVAPHPEVLKFVSKLKPEWRSALDYTHLPLAQQLEDQNVRQFEFDLFADPKGGLFAQPFAVQAMEEQGVEVADHDPRGQLKKPGIKVLHHQGFDFRTNYLTFVDALTTVKNWSAKNPEHVPIFILLELKDRELSRVFAKPVKWNVDQLASLEKEIESVFEADSMSTPDMVRGDAKTLREAVLAEGGPLLENCQGKVLFALDNGDPVRNEYLKLKPELKGALLFASVGEQHPAAAFFKINDPVLNFDRIQRLVKSGFLVRTRADADTVEARKNDLRRCDKALASGAQMVSTDFPVAVPAVSTYSVQLPGGKAYRVNPVRKSAAK